MKRYEKYKDSGVAWLGEIPEHWCVVALKYRARIFSGNAITANELCAAGKYEVYGGNGRMGYCDNYNVKGENIIIGRVGALCGNVRYINTEKYISDNALILQLSAESSYKFYEALLRSANLNLLNTSSAQPLITGAKVLNQKYAFPPLTEQRKIAEYLDYMVGRVDEIVSGKQAQIDRLMSYRKSMINEVVTKGLNPDAHMRDSGIEWLGEIPAHWEAIKIKYIGTVKGRIGFKGYAVTDLVEADTNNRAIVLGGTNVMRDGTVSFNKLTYLSEAKYDESPEIMLQGGEILITKVGAGVGENAIYRFYEDRVTINPNVMILLARSEIILPEYLNYYILTDTIKSQVYLESRKSGAQPAINQSFIKELFAILPSIEEQTEIVNHIEERTTKIDKIVKELTNQIEKLKEYKTSIVSEAVTGKIDLREWRKPNNN